MQKGIKLDQKLFLVKKKKRILYALHAYKV